MRGTGLGLNKQIINWFHLDVVNDKVVGVQTLVLSVALGVLQELEQELSRLERPSALGGSVNLKCKDG